MNPDPAVHAITGFVLTFVTAGMAVEFVLFLAVMWFERPSIGRDDRGNPRPVRPVRR